LTISDHPIWFPNGYHHSTRSIERTANYLLQAIENDLHGAPVSGCGGLGKSSMIEWLSDNSMRWLINDNDKTIGVCTRFIMPSGNRRSDSAFYTSVCNALRITSSDRLSPKRGKDRLVNFVKSRCGQANLPLMVMFVDCAQRILRHEFDFLADIDEQATDARLRLFLVLVRQSDATGIDTSDTWWSDLPSHMIRRWFMTSHRFEPLLGLDDISHALSRYDLELFWPDADMPYTRQFARHAYDDLGFRMGNQGALLMEGADALRAEVGMPSTLRWPMQSFSHAVRYLLTVVAGRNPAFTEFTPEHVREALQATGYLRLEYALANLIVDQEAA